MRALRIEGSWLEEPQIFSDVRGSFLEWFRSSTFESATGRKLVLAQANRSTSRRGVIRGIHFTDVPPGQAKYVTCVHGAVLDVIVDLRLGSPTFGEWEAVRLDDDSHRAVFLTEGLGHGFAALSDEATVVYFCSTGYAPERDHSVNPFDSQLGIQWPEAAGAVLSDKDRRAPSLAEVNRRGLLPSYERCMELYGPCAHRPPPRS